MSKKKYSFGLLEILSKDPLVERMTFNKEGNSHNHEVTEYCYVLQGSGKIIGSSKEKVKEGDYCEIPANTAHWMVPSKPGFKVLI